MWILMYRYVRKCKDRLGLNNQYEPFFIFTYRVHETQRGSGIYLFIDLLVCRPSN